MEPRERLQGLGAAQCGAAENKCKAMYFPVVLICLPLMISDVEDFFMYLAAICISSSEKIYKFQTVHSSP